MRSTPMTLLAIAALVLCHAAPTQATVVLSTDVPQPIPSVGTATSTLNFDSHLLITDVNGLINDISHTWMADLRLTLTSPAGTAVLLSESVGVNADGFSGTVFDDEAALPINAGSFPFSGSFRPQSPLSAFDGEDAFGIWTLTVVDLVVQDAGSINGWGIDVLGSVQAPIPEPETYALMMAGLGAIGLMARRRKQKQA